MTDVTPVLSTTVRGDEVSTTNDDILIEDVLKGNEEEYLLNDIMKLVDGAEDDPPLMFAWQNVCVFVQAIHEAQAEAAAPGGVPLPPDPLGLPAAVTEQNFKEAVLDYARVPGAPPRLGTACLPCTQAQFGDVAAILGRLDFDPWIQRIIAVGGPNSLPIAHLYVPRARSNTLDIILAHRPNSLWE